MAEPGEFTIADYYALPDDKRVELIDGVFYDMASPSLLHQQLLVQLALRRPPRPERSDGCPAGSLCRVPAARPTGEGI